MLEILNGWLALIALFFSLIGNIYQGLRRKKSDTRSDRQKEIEDWEDYNEAYKRAHSKIKRLIEDKIEDEEDKAVLITAIKRSRTSCKDCFDSVFNTLDDEEKNRLLKRIS